MTFPNAFGAALSYQQEIKEAVDRMADKAAYAKVQAAGGSMRIQPEKVEEVASFFRAEARAMRDRQRELFKLKTVDEWAGDPVTAQAATKYGDVGGGNPSAYLDNYRLLAQRFDEIADSLDGTAKQTRLDDENAADSMRR